MTTAGPVNCADLASNGAAHSAPELYIVKVAEAFGADGKVCETTCEVETAIGSAWRNRRLTVIQAIVDAGPYRV